MRNLSHLGMAVLLVFLVTTLAFTVQPAKAVGTIHILANGDIDPPSAPISTVDKITYTLTADISESIIVERNNTIIDGFKHILSGDGSGNGFELYNVANILVKNTNIQNFTYGIYLESASSITLRENNITLNSYDGIGLFSVSNSLISGNRISSNGYDGIEMYSSLGNNITGNFIALNGWFGIGSYDSSNSRIYENRILGNYNGIEIFNSPNTLVFHNDFINHTKQVYTLSTVATWDNGYPSGGNYWSDYNGTDANGDDIGDTPYIIDESNQDRYPLMYIYWNPADINHDLKVDIKDVSIAAKAFGSVPGDASWNPAADITGRIPLVPDGKVDIRDVSLIAKSFGKKYQ